MRNQAGSEHVLEPRICVQHVAHQRVELVEHARGPASLFRGPQERLGVDAGDVLHADVGFLAKKLGCKVGVVA